MDPSTNPPAEPSTDPSRANSPTDPPTEPATDPSTNPPTDPPTEPAADPSTNPPTDPTTDPPTDPPIDPPAYLPTDPHQHTSQVRQFPPLGQSLVPEVFRSTPPRGITEVQNRSRTVPLTPWTTHGVSYIPGGSGGYVCETNPIDNPPPYSQRTDKRGDRNNRKDGERGGDSSRHEYRIGDKRGRDYEQSDHNDQDGGKRPPKKKVARGEKTLIACHFCRGRKLKCSGNRPSCGQCSKRSNHCDYPAGPRRRGPGRKNKGLPTLPRGQQRERDDHSEASTSMSTPIPSSSFTFRHEPPSSYPLQVPLPGPPIPQYNYDLGQIQSSSVGLRTGTLSRRRDSSGVREPRRFDGDQLYSQQEYTRSAELRDYAQQPGQEQYHHRLTTLERQQPAQLYRDEYSQAPTSRIGNFYGGPSVECQSLHSSQVEENEGTSRPRIKRRRGISPPEDIGPSNPKQRRHYDPDEDRR